MARTLSERLRAHEQQKTRLAEAEARLKLDERRQRTRRLVEAGALVEKVGLLELDSNGYCRVVRVRPAMNRGRRLGSPAGRGAGHVSPGRESGLASGTVLVGGEAMAAELEVVVDAGVGGQEELGMAG